jgi:chorismate-pyruvate lyase
MATENRDFHLKKVNKMQQEISVGNAIAELNEILPYISDKPRYLDIAGTHHALLDITTKYGLELSPALKILLTTNGSVTQALQSLQPTVGDVVHIKTLNQVVLGIGQESVNEIIFQSLNLSPGSAFNYRKVALRANKRNLVLAISLTPISRLDKDFQDDLMRADLPIGFLLEKHRLAVLRRIILIDAIKAPVFINDILSLDATTKIPFRVYDITRENDVMMKIIEFFDPEL